MAVKHLYKSTKVIFDAHLKQYQVYYKNWLFWKFDSAYKYDEDRGNYHVHYRTKKQAEEAAICRAHDMLSTVEIWKQSNYFY